MKEELLHYLWKHALYERQYLCTTDGMPIEVQTHGDSNTDAGPDFFNARIKIGDTLWGGNVEIHLRSSDWFRHNHHTDSLYDSVILHVVANYDEPATRTNGSIVPTLLLPFNHAYSKTYENLSKPNIVLPCAEKLPLLDSFTINMWFERMLIERLEQKTDMVKEVLLQTTNNWQYTFYRLLARSFGTNVNAQAFEILSRSMPLSILAKHKDSVFQLEALLFGQAGMLADDGDDAYYQKLQQEYQFLQAKYSLQPMVAHSWKYMRMRPMNFPTIRIAQLAQLIHHSTTLLSQLFETTSVDQAQRLFMFDTSVYWLTHYTFGKASNYSQKHIGEQLAQTIIINAVVPIVFHYGKVTDNEPLCNKAFQYLSQLPFEKNHITQLWNHKGIDCTDAAKSQAIIHLSKQYCRQGRCLHCSIGDSILRQSLSGIL